MRNVDETMMETIENDRTTKQLHVTLCSLRMDMCNRPGWGFQLASLLQKPWCFKNWRRLPGVESSNIQWSISPYTNAKKGYCGGWHWLWFLFRSSFILSFVWIETGKKQWMLISTSSSCLPTLWGSIPRRGGHWCSTRPGGQKPAWQWWEQAAREVVQSFFLQVFYSGLVIGTSIYLKSWSHMTQVTIAYRPWRHTCRPYTKCQWCHLQGAIFSLSWHWSGN